MRRDGNTDTTRHVSGESAADVDTKVAAVLIGWLRAHGHPVVADDQLVPIGWLYDQLQHLQDHPAINVRTSPATAWRRAVGAVLDVLHRYEHELDDLAPSTADLGDSTP